MPAVRIDSFINGGDTVGGAAAAARAAEAAGLDGVWCGEVNDDPCIALALASAATERVLLGTGILTAFSRSPMSVAVTAHDLQRVSGGRFALGLGSQIKAHIERRFGMPWGQPVARLREYVEAVRAVWRCWDEGETLDFRGDFYDLTLMTPIFHPPANPYGPPPIFISAVGPRMTAMAGEVADGLFAHGFTTPAYLRDVTIPALGTKRPGFQVVCPVFVATGRDQEAAWRAAETTRAAIGFYGSTPAYRDVLSHHGWDDLHLELHRLTKEGRWADLPKAVPDDVVATFTAVAPFSGLRDELASRFGGVLDRAAIPLPADMDLDERTELVESLRQL